MEDRRGSDEEEAQRKELEALERMQRMMAAQAVSSPRFNAAPGAKSTQVVAVAPIPKPAPAKAAPPEPQARPASAAAAPPRAAAVTATAAAADAVAQQDASQTATGRRQEHPVRVLLRRMQDVSAEMRRTAPGDFGRMEEVSTLMCVPPRAPRARLPCLWASAARAATRRTQVEHHE